LSAKVTTPGAELFNEGRGQFDRNFDPIARRAAGERRRDHSALPHIVGGRAHQPSRR